MYSFLFFLLIVVILFVNVFFNVMYIKGKGGEFIIFV